MRGYLLGVLLIGAAGPAAAAAPPTAGKTQAGREHPFPRRSRQANQDLVDLSGYYTASLDSDWLGMPGANLASLPEGVQAFANAAFDVRGVIQLAGRRAPTTTGAQFPRAVKGIEINRKGRRLHFLHGTAGSAREDETVGEYVLHYASGQSESIPIVYRRNVLDWWASEGDPLPSDADVAWTGENEAAREQGRRIRLYRYTANNPLPNEELATIDFVSKMTDAAPFLVGMTVEPIQPTYEGFKAVTIDNPIPPRSPQAGPDLVDLSTHFNASLDDDWFQHPGHDFQELPRGVQVLGGVAFDVRGLIQLAGSQSLEVTGVVFPEAVKGISVNRKGRRLHFLQACGWSADEGARLGEYVVHYADGSTRNAPILYQRNVMDWWVRPEDAPPTEAQEVWRGSNPATRAMGLAIHVIKYTWENPLPDVEIRTIDFVSDVTAAAPHLLAITVEPSHAR
jgi:hypothetical protein